MYVSKLFNFFREKDFLELKINCNADQGSLWFSEHIDPEFIGFKMHAKQRSHGFVFTWYCKTSSDTANLRVFFDPSKDVMVISHLDTSTLQTKDIRIDDVSTLADEAVFFQRSTLEDLDDLQPEHIPFIIELVEKVTLFSNGMIDANKTCSS